MRLPNHVPKGEEGEAKIERHLNREKQHQVENAIISVNRNGVLVNHQIGLVKKCPGTRAKQHKRKNPAANHRGREVFLGWLFYAWIIHGVPSGLTTQLSDSRRRAPVE